MRGKNFEERMDAEMRFHLDQLTDELIERGLTPEAARVEARRQFGAVALAKDEARDERSAEPLRQFARDVRLAGRLALRYRGFSAAVVATLTLAIAASVAVFGVVYAVLLRPLPYPEPERLVSILNRMDPARLAVDTIHMRQFDEWQRSSSTLTSIAAYNQFHEHGTFNLTGRGEPERLSGIQVSSGLLQLLGAQPSLGRTFEAGEDMPGAAPVIVLSDGFWRRRFAANPTIVGDQLTINNTAHTVVGILNPDFVFSGTLLKAPAFDVFVPLVRGKEAYRFGMYLGVIGQLGSGISAQQAADELAVINKTAMAGTPLAGSQPEVGALAHRISAPSRASLWMLLGAVALLVCTGCANVANLFLARMTSRQPEVALRTALGASRARIMRQLVTESVLLASVGTAFGLALAAMLLRIVRDATWLDLPRRAEMAVHWPVAGFAILACAVTALLCGVAPARRASSVDTIVGLKSAGRGTAGSAGRRLRWALVSAQVGLSFVLLAGAGLLSHSLLNLLRVDIGFQPAEVTLLRVDPGRRYPSGARTVAFFDSVLERVRSIPGVTSAALGVNLPLDRNMLWDVEIVGLPPTPGISNAAFVRMVSDGYFATLGIPIRSGRDFASSDRPDAPRVVIVNNTLARRIAERRDPIGALMRIGGREHTVVAVVDDVKHEGVDREAGAEFYLYQRQSLPFPTVDVVVRSSLPTATVAASVRGAVWAIEPDQAVGPPRPLGSLVSRNLSPRRFFVWAIAGFAVFAVLLAFTGVYGVVSYAITTRTREIGVRMALGATRADIRKLFAAESAAAMGAGLLLGLVGALGFVRLIANQLYGVTSSDPLAFAGALLIVASSITIATLLPVQRAMKIDPTRAIGAE